MTGSRLRSALAVSSAVVLVSLATGGAGAATDTTRAPHPRPGTRVKVSSYGGVTAYSVRRSDGRYRLVVASRGGRAATARVPSRRMPFDVDVGPDVRGSAVLVYSRCRNEPPAFSLEDGRAARWFRASGCDLFSYDPARRRESRLGAGSSQSVSEFLPSIWRDQIAYVRRRAGSRVPQVRRARLGSPRTAVIAGRFPGARSDRPHPEALDLRGRRLGLIWAYLDDGRGCPDDDSLRLDPLRTYVYEVRGDARPAKRASACETTTDASSVSGGGFLDDGRLVWAAERYELSKGLVTAVRVVARSSSGRLSHGPERLLPGTYASLQSSTPFGDGVLGNAGLSFVRLATESTP